MHTFNTILFNLVAATTIAVVTVPGSSQPRPRNVPGTQPQPSAQRMIHGYRANQVGDFDASLMPVDKAAEQIFAGRDTNNKTVF